MIYLLIDRLVSIYVRLRLQAESQVFKKRRLVDLRKGDDRRLFFDWLIIQLLKSRRQIELRTLLFDLVLFEFLFQVISTTIIYLF